MKRNPMFGIGTFAFALALASTSSGQSQLYDAVRGAHNSLAAHQTANKTASVLTKSEIEGLLYMREEEKLAMDVYTILAKKWGARPFGNISQAEQFHMDSVRILLDKYGLADPAATLKPGQFKDQTLQKLYNDLVKSGGASRLEALKVGATIEDVDLYDLARWAKLTDKKDILSMYEVLANGSRNHMRAFVRNLGNSGTSYKPKFISQETFDKVISSTMERGSGLDAALSESTKISSSSTFHTVAIPLPLNRVAFFLGNEAVAAGFKVAAQHDLQASLAKEGLSVNPTLVVELCQPEVAFQALTKMPEFASAMPCRISLTEAGGVTRMSMILPTALAQAISDRTDAKSLALAIQKDLLAIVEKTSRRKPTLDQAWFDVNLPYKEALFASNNNDAMHAEVALRRSLNQWKNLSDAFVDEASRRASKEQWALLTKNVQSSFEVSLSKATSGDLLGAHESLEAVRAFWASYRSSYEPRNFTDNLFQFHEAMESAVTQFANDNSIQVVRKSLAPLETTWKRTIESDIPKIGPEESIARQRLLDEMTSVLLSLGRAVADEDRIEAKRVLALVKPLYVKLYMQFG